MVGYDELGGSFYGAPISAGTSTAPVKELPAKFPAFLRAHADRATYRRKAIWNAMTAGAEGIEVYYGFLGGCGDLDCQDHRTRANVWQDGARAVDFFETHIGARALAMRADDALTPDPDDYVFAKRGETYLIYTASSRPVSLALGDARGTFGISWFDPVAGGALRAGSIAKITAAAGTVPLGSPPPGRRGEWVVLVRRVRR